MSIGQTQSIALLGLTGSVVEIEVDISDGIPMYALLGTTLMLPFKNHVIECGPRFLIAMKHGQTEKLQFRFLRHGYPQERFWL
jgi:hypothetical protein